MSQSTFAIKIQNTKAKSRFFVTFSIRIIIITKCFFIILSYTVFTETINFSKSITSNRMFLLRSESIPFYRFIKIFLDTVAFLIIHASYILRSPMSEFG